MLTDPTRPAPAPTAGHPSAAVHRNAADAPCHRWDSRQLLGNAQQVEIHHGGTLYRLRLTSLGKLILTK